MGGFPITANYAFLRKLSLLKAWDFGKNETLLCHTLSYQQLDDPGFCDQELIMP